MDDHRAEAALHYGSINWFPTPDVAIRLVGLTFPGRKALWEYQEDYPFVWRGERHVIPAGFVSDLNSVPLLARLVIPQCGSVFDGPAGIHDYLRRKGMDYVETDRAYIYFAKKRGAAMWRLRLAALGVGAHSVLHAMRGLLSSGRLSSD